MNAKALSIPAVVVPPEVTLAPHAVLDEGLVSQIIALHDNAEALAVVDAASNEEAGMLLSMTTKLEKQVDEQRKVAKKPWADTAKAIDDIAKRATDPLGAIKTALKKKMAAYFDKVEADKAAAAVLAGPQDVLEQAATPKTAFTAVAKQKVWALKPGAQVPADYMMVDTAKVGAAVRAGILTPENAPWLSITEETVVKSTGK